MICTGKHKQPAVALNLRKFYFSFQTIVQSFSSVASSSPSFWISKPYGMIHFLHTYGHHHNFRMQTTHLRERAYVRRPQAAKISPVEIPVRQTQHRSAVSTSTASAATRVPAPAGCRCCRASSGSIPRGQSSCSALAFRHPVGLHSGASHFSLSICRTEECSGFLSRNPGSSLKPMLST